MSNKRLRGGLIGAALAMMSGAANASLLGAVVDISAENGFASGSNICKTASAIGRTVDASTELVAADWDGIFCVGFYSADLSGNSITLTGLESGNYSFAALHIHISSGPAITGASFAGYTPNFFQPGGDFNDGNFLPTVTFDADDINIVWDTGDDAAQFLFNGPAKGGSSPFGTAAFSVTTQQSVPEPATLALVGLAFVGAAVARRKA